MFRLNRLVHGDINSSGTSEKYNGKMSVHKTDVNSQGCLPGIPETTKFRFICDLGLIIRDYFVIR